jgi:hypothetical protein
MGQDWYYARDGKHVGPVTEARLQQLAAEGQLRPGDMIWRAGLDNWVPACSVVRLFRAPSRTAALPADAPRFLCPGCGKRLKAPESAAGRTVKCPKCGTAVVVPEAPGRTTAWGQVAPADEPGTPWLAEVTAPPPAVVGAPKSEPSAYPSDDSGATAGKGDGDGRGRRLELKCPICNSENVQSLKVIFEMGTSHVATIGLGAMSGYHGGEMVFGSAGTHQSRAAQNAAPPKRKDLAGPMVAIFLGVLFVPLGIGALVGDVYLLAIIALGFAILLLVCGSVAASQANKWNAEIYPELRQAWLNSFRCLKCGQVFVCSE